MQKANNTTKAFGYVRVSTATQSKDGESLAVQRQIIEAVCTLEGYCLQSIFIEQAVSGCKPFADRPQGQRILRSVQPGDVIISPRLDRAFRNTADALQTLAELRKRGVLLHLRDTGGLVGGNPAGELVFALLSATATFERARTRERVLEVRQSMRKEQRFMGGDPPFGHNVVWKGGKAYVEPDLAVLAEVSSLRAKGYSTRMISGYYAQLGVSVSHHAVARYLRRT